MLSTKETLLVCFKAYFCFIILLFELTLLFSAGNTFRSIGSASVWVVNVFVTIRRLPHVKHIDVLGRVATTAFNEL